MSFWTGLEAFTGHRPGAFTGMTMKDLFDKDMWEMRERLGGRQSRQFENTGVVPTTAIYKGMGKEGMFGDVVRPYAGAAAPVPANVSEWVNPNTQHSPVQMNQLGTAQAQTRALPSRPNLSPIPLSPFIPGVSSNQGLNSIRQWGTQNPNVSGSMGLDPTWAGGLRGAGLNAQTTTPPMLDKTTVVTESENPNEFNTTKTTYKQQVPANPTNTLMNMGRKFVGGWQDLARKRYEEEMLGRQRGY